jgi:hypothetical protein
MDPTTHWIVRGLHGTQNMPGSFGEKICVLVKKNEPRFIGQPARSLVIIVCVGDYELFSSRFFSLTFSLLGSTILLIALP